VVDGDGGEVPALPSCLEALDTREYQGAPRGTAAVPAFAKQCQSCHVSRHMAAGASLFRPFSTNGRIYDTGTFGTAAMPDKALYDQALGVNWTYEHQNNTYQVSSAYLTGLLAAPPKGCIKTGIDKFKDVTSVNELAMQLMANRAPFARGFMRHAQRAFSNLSTVTLEMGLRAMTMFEANKTTLPELVSSYFLTDSYACEANQ
jgi:hypothetical protein